MGVAGRTVGSYKTELKRSELGNSVNVRHIFPNRRTPVLASVFICIPLTEWDLLSVHPTSILENSGEIGCYRL